MTDKPQPQPQPGIRFPGSSTGTDTWTISANVLGGDSVGTAPPTTPEKIDVEVNINVIKPETIKDGDIIIMSFPESICQEALPTVTQQMKEMFPNNNIMFVDATQDIRILARVPGKSVNELLEETVGSFDEYTTDVPKKD